MLKIAITGNIACGKSFVGSFIKDLDLPLVDCDDIVHQILFHESEVTRSLKDLCREASIINLPEEHDKLGFIDRKKLGYLVFNDENLRKEVEKLIHPLCFKKIDELYSEWKSEGETIGFTLIPLLFETQTEKKFEKICLVYCNEEVQLARLTSRNPDLTQSQIEARKNAQISQEQKKLKSDYIIDNSNSREKTKEQVLSLIQKLTSNPQ